MRISEIDLTGSIPPNGRHLACIRTTGGLTVLAEMTDPFAALRHAKAEALNQVVSGRCRDLISVEVLNSEGDIVLGEMAEDLAIPGRMQFPQLAIGDRNL